jgi:hypothetical protein
MATSRRRGPILYFAYGGNMNSLQMAERCRAATPLAVARLADHKIAFFGHSQRWDGAEETVIAAPGIETWGVVYELSLSSLDRLDAWQGIRLDGAGRYFHSPAEVMGKDGSPYSVLLYRKDILGRPQSPSEEYLAHIVAGAHQQGLPLDYVRDLSAIPTVKAGYPVPQPEDVERILRSTTSCAC